MVHPFSSRKIPIIADTFVEKDFGTGAVKITPAHDPNDFDCGKRNSLPFINIFTDEGQVVEGCGQFAGMKRFDARKAVLEALTEKGLYRLVAKKMHVASVNSTCQGELLIILWWFLSAAGARIS